MIRFVAAVAFALAPAACAAVEVEEVTSPGGLRAWLVAEPTLPFVAIEIRVRGGAGLDPPDARGAANLMADLLGEGAGGHDARAFQEALEGLGATVEFDADADAVVVSATLLTRTRPEALALLRDALTAPRFDADAVERAREGLLSDLAWEAEDPMVIGWQAWNAASYPGHPYGAPVDGTPESVAALTREDLVRAHRDALTRGRVVVAVAGDITAAELGPLLDDLLGALPAEGPPLPPDVEPAAPGGIAVIDHPSEQSVVVFGHVGVARDDPDFFAALAVNHVLGGYDDRSRLWRELRVTRGLTYGVETWLDTFDHADEWGGAVDSANGTVAEAVGVIRDEWARIAAEGVTDAELAAAKTYLTGAYPLNFVGNGRIAGLLAEMQMMGLPPSYVADRNARIEAVTADDVRRVARERLDPAGLSFVVVGRPEGLDGGAAGVEAAAPEPTASPVP